MALTARHATHTLSVPSVRLPRPGLRGMGIGATAAFGLLLADALLRERTGFDVWGIKAVQDVTFPGLAQGIEYLEILTDSGGAVLAWALAIMVVVGLRWWLPAAALMTLPVGGVINYAVGEFLVGRTRPNLEELVRASGNIEERSFPSGHVQGAVMLYGLLFVIAGRIAFTPLRLAIRGGSLGIIGVIGFARIWDGAHWPTDVLGAYALGGMMLAPTIWLYAKLDALDIAAGRLPLIRAAAQPHDESMPHAHALTSLVLFQEERVAKVYAPGILPRAIYWAAFQAPFPYIGNASALRAAVTRRNLAGLLTEYWYGENRVARALGIETINGRMALTGEFVAGQAPRDAAAAKTFLRDLRDRFDAAGLPTWQIDPRQPRAVDNVLETADGRYMVVDLESGLVSPLASLRTWGRAIRRSKVPFFDEVFFDVTRAYVAREEAQMRAALGTERFAELTQTLDEAEREAAAWHRSELRLWSKLARGLTVLVQVHRWPERTRKILDGSQARGTAWTESAVAAWERDGRITAAEAATLREQIAAPTFQAMLPYLGAHILVSVPLRFPLGSIARPIMVVGALGVATVRLAQGRIDRDAWRQAFSIHSPLVALLAAVPGFGSFAYLAAKPVRANRLLLRAVTDSALQKAPKDLYERSGSRRWIARPVRPVWEDVPARAPRPLSVPALPVMTATPPLWADLAPAAVIATAATHLELSATSRSPKREDSRPADRIKTLTGTISWRYGWPLSIPVSSATKAPSAEEQPAPCAA